ncbi:helix-turn-helix domain-containing protein [Candidatus Woesearchaeota archaeon]|nr:helix-turn-helix domain-containing protein [Candidatus Woesearchaeota archaeon]
MSQRITILKIRKDNKPNINEELQWLGSSLGLFNLRDRDSSCFRLFITLVKSSKHNEPVSSDEIARRLNLTRGTVVHHLHKLMDAGIVVKEKEGYILREGNIERLIEQIHRDMEDVFREMEKVAKEIDEDLG